MTTGEYNTVHGIHLEKCTMIIKRTENGIHGRMEGWMNALLDGWINGWPHHTTTQLSIHLPGPDTAWT